MPPRSRSIPKGTRYLISCSHFLYSDFILNNQVKTGMARLPINLLLEYEQNLNAASNPLDIKDGSTGLGRQNKAYGAEVSVGQTRGKNDVQFGYSWWRIERDAIIASFAESDQRAPTNILQNRIYGLWKPQQNVLAQYTLWFGRMLNDGLENNVGTVRTDPGATATQAQTLKRQQVDLIYTF